MNRFHFSLIALFLLLIQCTVTEKPEFINIENIKINSISKGEVDITVNAIFENKNDIGGEIYTDHLDILIDSISVGSIKTKTFTVPAKSEFTIPLQGNFSTKALLNKKPNDLLKSVLNFIGSKKVPLTIKGDLVFKKGPFEYAYPVNQTEEIKLKF